MSSVRRPRLEFLGNRGYEEILRRVNEALEGLIQVLRHDAAPDAFRTSLAKLNGPVRDLHSDYSDRLVPAFGQAAQRLLREEATVTELGRGVRGGRSALRDHPAMLR